MNTKYRARQYLAVILPLMLLLGCQSEAMLPTSMPDPIATTLPTASITATPTADKVTAPISEPIAIPADWDYYQDSTYQFQIALPPDWSFKVMDANVPGTPDDWPVKSVTVFYPSSMDEQMNREGPPDPTAPPVVPPFSVEVCPGSEQDFRRAYPEVGISETTTINGISVMIERENRDDMIMIRYVFAKDSLRVVFVDVVSGFSERVAAFPEFPELMTQIVNTFAFLDEEQPNGSDASNEYQQVNVPELGLVYELPKSWYQSVNGVQWLTDDVPGAFIGVKWLPLEAPQEPEAVMLPRPSQITFSGDYDFEGNPGRMIGLETYAEAPAGDEKAPVKTVETHVLVVLESDGQRYALDVYAGAASQVELESVIAVYQHLLGTLRLQTN